MTIAIALLVSGPDVAAVASTPPVAAASPIALTQRAVAPASLAAAGGRSTASTMPRELWVWHIGDPTALVASARRHRVTRLLVWVSPGFSRAKVTLASLRDLHARAAASGIAIDALCGDPSWAMSPAAATKWAAEVRSTGLFERIHLDIEPNALPNWGRDRSALAAGLLSAVAGAKTAGLPTDVDIPSWFDTVAAPGGTKLDVAVMRLASSVTVMAYRNNAAAVLAAAAAEIADAQRLGTPAWIGLNTASTGGDPASTSYLGQSAAAIEADIAKLDISARRWPSFVGLALHDAASIEALDTN